MDILFECEYVLDKEKYLAWGRESYSAPFTWASTVFLWIIVAALIYYDRIFCFVGFVTLALYHSLFSWRTLTARQYSLLARKYGTENWTMKISFGEDSIVTSEGNISVSTSYSELTLIEEKGNYIKLHLKNQYAIRLYSDCFVKGTWEECKAHLLRQMKSN